MATSAGIKHPPPDSQPIPRIMQMLARHCYYLQEIRYAFGVFSPVVPAAILCNHLLNRQFGKNRGNPRLPIRLVNNPFNDIAGNREF